MLPKDNRAVVQGVNIAKRHTKPTGMGQPGGIIEREATIHLSNIMLVDPEDRQADPRRASGCSTTAARSASPGLPANVIEG